MANPGWERFVAKVANLGRRLLVAKVANLGRRLPVAKVANLGRAGRPLVRVADIGPAVHFAVNEGWRVSPCSIHLAL
jgi:hypothetical protein